MAWGRWGGFLHVLLLCAVLAVASVPSCLALRSQTTYAPGSPVVELDPASFDSLVLQSPDWWMVVWYHPSCGHCRLLRKAYAAAASRAAANGVPVRFGAVNCKVHWSFGNGHHISYYPALFLYGANKSSPIEYEGWRSTTSLQQAVTAFATRNGTSIPWGVLDYFVFTVKTISLHYRTVSSCFLLLLLLCTFLFIYDNNFRSVGRFVLYELGLPVERWSARGPPLLPVYTGRDSPSEGSQCCCSPTKITSKGGGCCGLRRVASCVHDRVL